MKSSTQCRVASDALEAIAGILVIVYYGWFPLLLLVIVLWAIFFRFIAAEFKAEGD